MNFYSNGKLLLTGEYVVLDGAKALAIPTSYGQEMQVITHNLPQIQWKSLNEKNEVWFDCILSTVDFEIKKVDFSLNHKNEIQQLVNNLKAIFQEIRNLKSDFLTDKKGVNIVTKLNFPRNWGLGSSSTLINNLANWADVNPYLLLKNTFGGSGYDIACAEYKNPIVYQLINDKSLVMEVDFNPSFKNQLFFIHLNKKQNSRDGIEMYKKNKNNLKIEIEEISTLTEQILTSSDIQTFEKLLHLHEQIIGKISNQKPIQNLYFNDYFGQIKSLGAWGGDFILATGNENTPDYFIKKGFQTILPFEQMRLKIYP